MIRRVALILTCALSGCADGPAASGTPDGAIPGPDRGPAVDRGVDRAFTPDAARKPTLTKLRSLFEMSHGAAVDPAGHIFIADSYGKHDATPRVYRLDPPYQGALSPTTITGSTPAGLLWHGGSLYVCDVSANAVRVHDATLAPVQSLSVPMPWNVQVLPDKSLLVVTFDGRVIRLDDSAQTEVLSGLEHPFDIVAEPDGKHFWVSEQGPEAAKGGGVRRHALDGTLDVTSSFGWVNPEGIARGPQGDIWVAETALGQIVRVTPDGSAAAAFGGLTLPAVITPFPDGDLLVVTVRQDTALYRVGTGS